MVEVRFSLNFACLIVVVVVGDWATLQLDILKKMGRSRKVFFEKKDRVVHVLYGIIIYNNNILYYNN